MTLTQHILSQQRLHSQARGELTGLLTQIGVAAKVITSQIRKAGLTNIIGSTGRVNIQGEDVQKLDDLA
ncbi:MAG: class 1 fructose-bisphosphatase, partial [Myxococcota bacterium]|nr:class 1 fructose-bisphosphatase [Myxococcota bacterium]